MANDITGTTWVLDTAGVISTASLRIKWIAWVSDGATDKDIAADDDLLVRDAPPGVATGKIVFSKRAETAGDGINYAQLDHFCIQGLNLVTMDGGIFLVGLA